MPLKKKDGSEYKLQSPSKPVPKINSKEYILHNFKWEFETKRAEVAEEPKVSPPIKQEVLEIPQTKILEELFTPIETAPEPVIQAEQKPTSLPKSLMKNAVLAWCLPINAGKYGEKFTLHAVIADHDDMVMRFWTLSKITKNSIIFPSKFLDPEAAGKLRFDGFRWWQVRNVEPKSGGFFCECIPSALQPDFSS